MTVREFDRKIVIHAWLCLVLGASMITVPIIHSGFHAATEQQMADKVTISVEKARLILDESDNFAYLVIPAFASAWCLEGVFCYQLLRKRRRLNIKEQGEPTYADDSGTAR